MNLEWTDSRDYYSAAVYGGDILDFHFLNRYMTNLKDNIFSESQDHFYTPADILIVCRAMQLKFLKQGNLSYAAIYKKKINYYKQQWPITDASI